MSFLPLLTLLTRLVRFPRFLFALTAAFALGSCMHEPSPTGLDLLPGEDLVGVERFDSRATDPEIRTSSWFVPANGATSQFLYLGKTEEYTGRIAIRWIGFPGSIAEAGRIVSASVTLYATPYKFGDTLTPLVFEAREILSPWSSYTLTSDSISAMRLGSVPAGSFNGFVRDSVEFTLDTAVVRSWLVKMAALRYGEIYGVLLEPKSPSAAVYAFEAQEAFNRKPVFRIVMSLDGVNDTTFYASSLEDTFVAEGPKFSTASLTVHGGLSWRGGIRFDLSAVPRGSIVNAAALTFTVDPARRRDNIRGIDSLWVYARLDTVQNTLGSERTLTRTADSGRFVAEGLVITRMVQRWVNHPETNNGFALVKLEEGSDLDGIGFYDAAAPAWLKPRLVITYTLKP
ncbi:MAG: hypothetical protein QHI48_06730 [Bacteroidota bacterium]|nr:hypothetical protein [Bacteroidota bacterium]